MKSALVATGIGRLALSLREKIELIQAAARCSENLGELVNDQIARRILERFCSREGVFIDVGAHIGSVIDGVQVHAAPKKIIAFEAIPEKAAVLRRKFPNIELHCCALGPDTGDVSFYVATEQSGYSSLDADMAGQVGNVREITVPLRRMDEKVDRQDAVEIIKIDVEGAELGVMMGAADLLARRRPLVMFESGPRDMAGMTKAGMWQFLESIDYAVVTPNRVGHRDAGLTCEGVAESHLYPRRTTNYFAVPRERRDEVRNRARVILGLFPD